MPCPEDQSLIATEMVKLMTQTGQCYRPGKTGDGRGGFDISAGDVVTGSSFPCLAYPEGKKKGDKQEVEDSGHVLSVDPWELIAPLGTDLRLRDRVLVDGTVMLEVAGGDKGRGLAWNLTFSCIQIIGAGEDD